MRWVLIGAFVCLAACASDGGTSANSEAPAKARADCDETDWGSVGQRDGLYGEAPEKLNERAAECAGALLAANTEDYQRGRARGLATYCSPSAGYDAGRNGREYRGVCPADSESAFLDEYREGRALFDLTERVTSSKAALALASSTIESDRFELKRALESVSNIDATNDEKGKAIENVQRYRQNIGRLEEEIPKLQAAIADAETALKARQK